MRNVSLFDLYDGNEASANLIGICGGPTTETTITIKHKTAVVIYLCYIETRDVASDQLNAQHGIPDGTPTISDQRSVQ